MSNLQLSQQRVTFPHIIRLSMLLVSVGILVFILSNKIYIMQIAGKLTLILFIRPANSHLGRTLRRIEIGDILHQFIYLAKDSLCSMCNMSNCLNNFLYTQLNQITRQPFILHQHEVDANCGRSLEIHTQIHCPFKQLQNVAPCANINEKINGSRTECL